MIKQILIISILMSGISKISYSQNEIEGYWLAGEGNTIVQFVQIDIGAFQGKIVWLKEKVDKEGNSFRDEKNPDELLRSREILGLPIVERADYENDTWIGKIYSVKNGRTVNAIFRLQGDDKLEVRVNYRGFKRTQTWYKTEKPD